jgi:hypothetical protein
MHRVEAAVQNFERFTNKFTDLEEISDIVAHYIKAKNQTKMEINKLIYLQEFQKFGDEKKLKKGSALKETFISNIDRIKEKYLPEAENTFSNPGKTAQEGKHEESTRDKEMTAEKTKFQGGSTGQQFFRTKTMSQQLQRPMRSSKTLASLTGKNAAQ